MYIHKYLRYVATTYNFPTPATKEVTMAKKVLDPFREISYNCQWYFPFFMPYTQ